MGLEDKIPVSVAIITLNEEKRIRACLESVTSADDIVVLDSGSTDNTLKIAEEYGCRIFQEDWKGYGPQKNSAIEKCVHDFVLIIDADERIPSETMAEIGKIVNAGGSAGAYSFTRKNYFRGRWIKHAGEWPDRQVRLVRKGRGRYKSMVHEDWVTEGFVEELGVSIEHFSYQDFAGWLNKMNEYSSLSALKLHGEGREVGVISSLMHGFTMFFKTFILKRGFLEGVDGLVICVVKSLGSYLKYAKLTELNKWH